MSLIFTSLKSIPTNSINKFAVSFEEADAEVGIILSRFEEQFYEKCTKATKFGQSRDIKVDVQQAHGMPLMTTEVGIPI